MGDIRGYWGCDHAPGRGTITLVHQGVSAATLLYFECRIVQSQSEAKMCIGIADASFNVTNPVSLDLSAGVYAGLNHGCFTSFGNPATANTDGWSGGTAAPSTHGIPFSNLDWIGVAIDTANKLIWWRNATAAPTTWYGNGGLSPDPTTGTNGYAYTNASISGKIFILAGGGHDSTATEFLEGSLNTGQYAFEASIPTGFFKYQTSGTILNASDASADLTVFDPNNESFTTTAITGSNQPTAFGRSVVGY